MAKKRARRRARATTQRATISSVSTIPDPTNIYAVADWAEYYISYLNKTLSRSTLIGYLEDAAGEDTRTDIDAIWRELRRRIELYGENPPYLIKEEYLEPQINWRTRPEYMMCLLLSMLGNQQDTTATGSLFEQISAKALEEYIGGKTIAYGIDQPTLKSVAEKLNEKFIEEPAGNFQDRGVDVIGWRSFDDTRSSQLIVLLQSASGWNWTKKTRDIPYYRWCQYIHWAARPVLSFAMPGIFIEDQFHEISTEVEGFIFDRARIYKNPNTTYRRQLSREISAWCRSNFASLREGQPAL